MAEIFCHLGNVHVVLWMNDHFLRQTATYLPILSFVALWYMRMCISKRLYTCHCIHVGVLLCLWLRDVSLLW